MNNKIWIVAQREFNIRVRKKSFIIMTILMPFMMAALIFLPLALSMIKEDGEKYIAVIDNTGLYADEFKSDDSYKFIPIEKMDKSFRSDTTEMAAVIQITDDLVEHPRAAAIYSSREVPHDLRSHVEDILTSAVRKQKINSYQIPELENILEDIHEEISVDTIKWTDEGEQQSLAEIASLCGMILNLLIYMFVMAYGSMVMTGVIEEKTNRIVELMVSSVKPTDMLMGKIIGVGLVGLLQMLIWGVLLSVLLTIATAISGVPVADPSATAAMTSGSEMDFLATILSLPLFEMFIMFVLFFIGGYLLYASILAAFGSAVNDQQDSQQFMMPILIVMMFALYAGIYSAENPEGPLAFWASFIPFTSPLVMMVRIPFGVPVYQEIISIAILFATVLLIIKVSAKIYRVGILMYGKKPSWKDLIKWLKY